MMHFRLNQALLLVVLFLSIESFGQAPTVAGFSPASGAIGSTVTITGTNFSTTPANNIVYFGGVKANVSLASATQLTVAAPAGTTYQPISVTVNGLIAYSKEPFNVTFSGAPGFIETGSFSPKVDFSTGSNPNGSAIADLDGDGKLDLALVNQISNTVSLFRNTSTSGAITAGSFVTKVDFTTGSNPNSISISDVDGDGKLDLAVVNQSSSTVSIFRNTSNTGAITNGSFAAKVDFTTGSSPYNFSISDLDGDGKPELAVVNSMTSTISVFRNTSTSGAITSGSFAAKVDFTTGSSPRDIAIADVDGDGKREMVVGGFSNLSIFRNTSTPGSITTASFDARVDFPVVAISVGVADLDGDGKPDLATANSGTVSILRNVSDIGAISAGSFAPKVDFTSVTSMSSILRISINDLDGDGKPDLVVNGDNNGGTNGIVSVFRNTSSTGAITTSSFATKVDFTTGSSPYSVSIGDLDGDGAPEMVVANYGSSTVSVFRNVLNQYPTITSFSPTSGSIGTVVTINGTNFSTTPANNVVKFGSASTTATASTTTSVTASVPFGASVGKIQVIVDGRTSTSATDFQVPTPTISSFSPTSGAVGSNVTITGTNFSTAQANNIVYFGASKATVTDATPTQLIVNVPIGATYQPISVTVNGLTAYSRAQFNVTFTGAPAFIEAGSFSPKVDFTTGSNPNGSAIADLDGDGKLDLAVVNSSSSTVSIFRNTSTTGAITNGSFAGRVDFTTGSSPSSISISDVDGDGKLDLAVVYQFSSAVSIFRNTSTSGVINTSSFAARVDFTTTNSGVPSISIGDLDGDAKPELVVVNNTTTGTVSVFRNTSTPGVVNTGSFAAKVDFTTGSFPRDIAIADVDGDGKREMIVSGSGNFSIFRNTSTSGSITTASFDAKVDFPVSSISVGVADLDGDGKPDLVTATSGTVTIRRNTSDPGIINSGSFATQVDFTSVTSMSGINRISITDMDGDGKPDLVVNGDTNGTVSVFRNTSTAGAITTNSFATKVDFTTGSSPYSVSIGDLDGDGAPEMAVANYGSSTVSVFRNVLNQYPTISSFSPTSGSIGTVVTISGTNFSATPGNNVVKFGSATTTATASTTTSVTASVPFGASVGKIQVLVEGRTSTSATDFQVPTPTISTFSPTSGEVGSSVVITGTNFSTTFANNIVYFGATKATVTDATPTQLIVTLPFGATYQPLSVTVNGLTAYSRAPFVITFPSPRVIEASSFNTKVDFAAGSGTTSIALGDLDGDGKPDVAVANNSNTFSVFRNTSTLGAIVSGSFASKVDFTSGFGVNAVSAVDLDGDGKLDVVVANSSSSTISLFRNTSVPGIITSGSFAAKVDLTTTSTSYSFSVGDIDGDGKPDLVVSNTNNNTISIFRNTTTPGAINAGSFASRIDFITTSNPRNVSIGDLDGDGKPDLAVANSSNSSVSVFRNTSVPGTINGSSFASKVDFTTGSSPYHAAIGDLNGDGKPELAVANNSSGSISIFQNTSTLGSISTASFAAKVDFTTAFNPYRILISDLDGDGMPDLATVNLNNSSVSLLRNTSNSTQIDKGSFAPKVDLTTATSPYDIVIGDLDGNGNPELITANNGSISVFRNSLKESPIITSVSPGTGAALTSATITGSNFSDTQANNIVTFNNIPAIVTASTTTSITTSVPAGATSGKIQVTVGGQNAFSPTNFVVPVPMITNFTPASGPVGTSVTINGANFNTKPASNIVYFGATRADVSEASATQLKVIVPSGATYQPITVIANSLIAYSPSPFIVTFTPSPLLIEANAFSPKVDFPTGINPRSIAIGDLDGDRKADLVITNSASNTISIVRNASISGAVTASSFESKVDFETTSGPYSLSLGDIDADGKLDIAVTNYFSNTVSVFRNTSTSGALTSGSFAAKVDFATGGGPYSVSIGDLDGDGKPELAVANNSNSTISVIKNIGIPGTINSSSFASKVDFVTGSNAFEISIGDLDGDGKPELVTANSQTGTISILKNTTSQGVIESGSFASKIDFSSPFPYSISIGDLDGDNKPDLAVANYGFSIVSVFRNTTTFGAITTSSFAAKVDLTAGSNVFNTAISDLNGDGKPELVVINNNSSTLSIFRNTSTSGAITATSFATKVDFITGSNPLDLAIGDLDGDGVPELITTNNANTISVFRNTLRVPTPPPSITNFSPNKGPVGTSVTITGAKFSTIKDNNIVYFGATKAEVKNGSATQLTVSVPSGATYQPISVTVDGLTAYSNAPFNVTFPSPSIIDAGAFSTKVDFGTGLNPRVVAVGDLDGDGKPDLVVVNNTSNTISMFRNTGTAGAIAPGSFSTKVDFETGAKPSGIALGDLDGDGRLDVAVANFDGNTVSIFQNKSIPGTINTSSFASKVDFNTASQPISVAIRDLNGDGKPELAATNTNSAISVNSISVFWNTSVAGQLNSSSFANKVDFVTEAGPFTLTICDLDGDGRPDLATANHNNNSISILRNISNQGPIVASSFDTKVDFAGGSNPRGITSADLDGDGKPDLAIVNATQHTISVYRNTCTPGVISFASQVTFPTGTGPIEIASGDLDGDGKPDLATINNNAVSVFKNSTAFASNFTGTSFATKVDFATGGGPLGLAIGDLNGDGGPELITGNISVNTISVLQNNLAFYLSAFSPASGAVGATVTLSGNFSPSIGSNLVQFNGTNALVNLTTSTKTALVTTVPLGASSGKITLTINGKTLTSATEFEVVGPKLTSFSPLFGAVGTTITISGTNLSTLAGDNIIKFGDAIAQVTPISSTSLTAIVPASAATGKITIEVQGALARSNNEFVVLPFKITSFAPAAAAVNSTVTVIGSGFSSVAENNTVLINGEKALVTYADPETLKVTIPSTASTGIIKVVVEGVEAISENEIRLIKLGITGKDFPVNYAVGNSSVQSTIIVNDITEVQSIKFFSKGISSKDPAFTSEDVPIPTTGNSIRFLIPSARFNDPIGLQYYFSLTDKNGITGITSEEGFTYLSYPIGSSSGIPNLIFGKGSESYQLISIPLKLKTPSVEKVFENLGSYKKNKWRLFSFVSPASIELNGQSNIELGKGYWLIVKNQTDINPGEGATPEVTDKNPYTLNLVEGWNLIGNPYNFTISWSDVLAANNNPTGVGNLKLYKAGFVQGDLLVPYSAAFVRLDGVKGFDLKIPVINKGISGRKKNPEDLSNPPLDSNNWLVKLILDDGLMHDELGGIGMNSEANEGKDLFDEVVLPTPEGLNNFELVLKELSKIKLVKDVVPTKDEHTWTGQIWSENGVTISWDNSYFGKSDKRLVFETIDRVELTDMKNTSSLKLSNGRQEFKIHFGSDAYVKRATIDKEPRVGEVFPNPLSKVETLKLIISLPHGTSHVQMEMKDLNGKNTFSGGIGKYDEGRQVIEWVADFSSLPTGLYVVKILVNHSNGVSTFYKKVAVE